MSHFDFQGGIKLPIKYENIGDSDFKFINEKNFYHTENIPVFYSFKSHHSKKQKTKQD